MTDRTVTDRVEPLRDERAPGVQRAGVVIVFANGSYASSVHTVSSVAVVGREVGVEILTPDANCSREHARLEPRAGGFWLTDLGSRNGSFVNGERVGADGAWVPLGAVIRVGRTLLFAADVGPYLADRPPPLPGLLGGASLDPVRLRIDTIARAKSPVLILGETGTGKEVVARLVHEQSGRAGSFVALNCAAVPSELVDAELFGHARGAFSGASTARNGQFRTADHGTLFLDEIGEMPAGVQAKLLRTLETGEVRPVGEDRVVNVDVRVVAATNRELDALIETGGFRADLLHRLAGLRVELPPLRERRADIAVLTEHFAAPDGVGMTAQALERLMSHDWPGNVRELRNVVTAAAAISRRRGMSEIELDVVQGLLGGAPESAPPAESSEAERVRAALAAASGDVAAAATELGMSRSALYSLIRRLGVNAKDYRPR